MMKSFPYGVPELISVIIPTCDRPADLLDAAVDSALGQTKAPLEVIVVDNGIEDAGISSQREGVVVYRLPPRVGPSRARNFGAALSKGTHLAFLDDDDLWDKNFLHEAASVLQSDGTRCVYGRIDVLRDGKQYAFKEPTAASVSVPILLEKNPGTGGINLLIEKHLFWLVGGFKEDLLTSEDKALAIDVLELGERISVAPDAISIARHHSGARLTSNIKGRIKFLVKYRNRTSRFHFARLVLWRLKQTIMEIVRVNTSGIPR